MKTSLAYILVLLGAAALAWRASAPEQPGLENSRDHPSTKTLVFVPKGREAVTNEPDNEAVTQCDAWITLGTDAAIQQWSDAVHAEADPVLRLQMTAALDALSSREGLELVTSALVFATDETVLDAVQRTITRMADADTVAHLAELRVRADLGESQRAHVLAALAGIHNTEALEAQARLAATHPAAEVRAAAAASLALMDTPESALALIHARAALPPEAGIERSMLLHHLSRMSAAPPVLETAEDPALRGLLAAR
ncbi:MAG TPA: hypothetical protein PLP58_15030 [Prosthecobacter sp.]|nr:hypothetical protein [Prosthecobacter sp.]